MSSCFVREILGFMLYILPFFSSLISDAPIIQKILAPLTSISNNLIPFCCTIIGNVIWHVLNHERLHLFSYQKELQNTNYIVMSTSLFIKTRTRPILLKLWLYNILRILWLQILSGPDNMDTLLSFRDVNFCTGMLGWVLISFLCFYQTITYLHLIHNKRLLISKMLTLLNLSIKAYTN